MLTASPRLAAIDPPEEPLPVWRCLRTMVDNPLKAWPAAFYREPLYRSRILGHPTVYVMAPDLVRAVLLDESDSFEKGEDARRALGSALGDAILLADGPRWLWQRRAVAPIFRPERTRDFLPAMIAAAERTRDRWRALPPGSEIDLAQEMAHTTFDIILSSMLPGPGSIDAEVMRRCMSRYLEPISWVMALAMIGAPRWLPYPGMFRARRARDNLHRMLEALIAETSQAPESASNLLSLLVHASDPQTGKPMNAVDVRNNLFDVH